MNFQYLGAPAGARVSTGGSAGGGTPFTVRGKGLMAGGPDGAIARAILAGGPLRIENPDAVAGNPRITMLPTLTEIARANIDLSSPLAQRIDIIPDMDECEVDSVSFRRFSATPPVTMMGGVYAASPTGAGTSRINPPAAAIVDEATRYDGWAGGLAPLRAPVIPAIRRLVALWWCPRLVAGVATPGPAGLTCEVVVYGLPKWAA